MDVYEDIDFNKPNSPHIQKQILKMKEEQCQEKNVTEYGWCPEVWDKILCWPSTPPGELAILPCPSYIAGFDVQANASRECMPNGQWFWNNGTEDNWSNYTQCYRDSLVTLLIPLPAGQQNNDTLIQKFVPIVRTISKVGYTVSFFTLVVAFFILAVVNFSRIGRRKLRCPRNMLHMHLFASFMLRAFMELMKNILFVSGIALASDVMIRNGETYWLVDEKESNWLCKVFISFWQYFILANYFWILMEGLYLHNLVFLALFTDVNSSIAGYVCLGWGLPAIFVSCWIVARIKLDDMYCWTTHEDPYLFLIIRVPTTLSILINFVLFVNIVRVLLSKLKSTVSEETQRYKRWAKSTLVLVPLFGVHYTVFLGMSYSIGVNETVEVVWLFCDQLFASFQGFFVAILYCFLNGEVRTEVSRTIRGMYMQMQRVKTWEPLCIFMLLLRVEKNYGGLRGAMFEILVREESQQANHASPLYCKYTDQSLLSFCSNVSEVTACTGSNVDRVREQHRWSDSECCHLTHELHNLHNGPP
ncbi:Parathyroid hormone/parathyroid hormone-related peptide receptor [Anthophora plagiata]